MPFIIDKDTRFTHQELIDKASSEGVILLIDKEKTWTSFDVVAKVRNTSRIKKVGHGGTLDPLATGLLILGLGKGTKLLENFAASHKSYFTTIKLGATTKSYDAEAEEENIVDVQEFSLDKINEVLNSFLGKQQQIPPVFSAKTVNGVRSYKLARQNEAVELNPINIEITRIKLLNYTHPYISFDVECSKGTYIRSLADDIGKVLGCGAYLADLRRTEINEYNVENALTVKQLIEYIDTTRLAK